MPRETRRTIVVVGSINMDLVVTADALPREGHTVLGHAYHTCCGGKGANQAIAAARAGGRVRMIGSIGDDDYGRAALRSLRAAGVGVRGVQKTRDATGVALIVLDREGRNLIAVAPNANQRTRIPREPFDIVVTQLETPYSIPRARCFILNPAPADRTILKTKRGSKPLKGVHVIIPNEHEAAQLTGESDAKKQADALLKLGASRAIVTLGERGVYDSGAGAVPAGHRSAFHVKPVDTVGAGDAFVGAFAAALSEDVVDPVRYAQAAAAIACTRRGAQASPTRAEIERFLTRNKERS